MLIDLCLEWLPPLPNKEVKPGSGFSYDAFVGRINKGNIPSRQKKIIVRATRRKVKEEETRLAKGEAKCNE